MASRFWRRGSPERPRYVGWLAWMAATLLTLLSRSVAANVDLVPSSDGYLGAWQLAGPYPGAAAPELDVASVVPDEGKVVSQRWGSVWRSQASGSGALDLKTLLATGERAGRVALAAGHLVLGERFDGWLLLSVDGSVDVRVNGESIWSRKSQRLRGSSWDAIALDLEPGVHRIVLVLTHPGLHWAFEARLLERETLRPPVSARWRLQGTSERMGEHLLRSMARVEVRAGLEPRGFRPRVRVSYPRGMPVLGDPVPVTVESTRPPLSFEIGKIVVNRRGAHPLEATLPYLSDDDLAPGTHSAKLTVSVGSHRFAETVSFSRQAAQLSRRANAVLEKLPRKSASIQEEIVRATTDWMLDELAHAADQKHAFKLVDASKRLEAWLSALDRTPMPFLLPGVHELAHYSDLDDAPQPFRVHVPQNFVASQGGTSYPAVLALHGYNGSPRGIMEAFLDSRSQRAKAGVDGFVIAPMAYGNAFYRGPGEHEAMLVLELLERIYPIDPNRVAVTGVSMGGTGTAQLALRYADDFSSAAPLCGYHSYFIRRDTRGRRLRPWEEARMHHWSTSSWVANGGHLPLFVAHGTRDHPLENSKVLIRGYRDLGQTVTEEWPDTGHSVWKVSYRGARLWSWLSKHTRPSFPERVTVKTDTLRYGRQYWLELTRFERHGTMGQIDARRVSDHEYALDTTNVSGLQLLLPDETRAKAVKVTIDGQPLRFAPGEDLSASRQHETWSKSPPSTRKALKRAGVEGPIRDVFLDRVTFVYGSGDERTRRANREVAESFGRYHYGMQIDYPVISDAELDAKTQATSSLVLVGTPRDHAALARLDDRLPIHATSDAISVAGRQIEGSDAGAIFIYPNPDAPGHYVLVITAPSPAGIWRALSLPRLLPDFVVYDERLADAANEQVLGTAEVRLAGFFASDWALPEPGNP